MGTYSELLANRGAFAEFLKTYAAEQHQAHHAGEFKRDTHAHNTNKDNSSYIGRGKLELCVVERLLYLSDSSFFSSPSKQISE